MNAMYPLGRIAGNIYGSMMPMCSDEDWQAYSERHRQLLKELQPPQPPPNPEADPVAADRELNHVYQKLLEKLHGDSRARRALIEAERSWIPYRDAMLSLQASVLRDQTDARRQSFATAVSRQRIRDLKGMLNPDEGDDACGYAHPMSLQDLEDYGIKDP